MKIWQVRCDVENYAPIRLWSDEDYKQLPYFEGKPFGKGWKPFNVSFYTDLPRGDFSYLTAGVLGVRSAILTNFPERLNEEIEILPLGGDATMSFLSITNVVDCLDENLSEISYYEASKQISRVKDYVFHIDELGETYLFKIPQLPRTRMYATERFKAFIEENEYVGLRFSQIYDSRRV